MQNALKKSKSLSLFSDKVFYKIGEVSKLLEIESYVLRYWESEFPFLRPQRTKTGQRIYTKHDIELLHEIKRLLYEEKYTIDGVKKRFEKNSFEMNRQIATKENGSAKLNGSFSISNDEIKIIHYIKKRLREIIETL